MKRLFSILLAFFLLLSVVCFIWKSPVSAATVSDSNGWTAPTLADTVFRSGRDNIKKAAYNWRNFLSVTEHNTKPGLTFAFKKAVGSVSEGLDGPFALDGLTLQFSDMVYQQGKLALTFGSDGYERFGFGLVFDPQNGTVQAASPTNLSAPAFGNFSLTGDVLLQDDGLKASALSQDWTVGLTQSFDKSYTLTICADGKVMTASLPQKLVESGVYDPTNCTVNLMAYSGLPVVSLRLAGWKQLARPQLLAAKDTILLGTGDYGDTANAWSKWLSVTEKSGGGLNFNFTGAAHSVAEGLTAPVSLENLTVHLDNLASTDTTKLNRFAITFGTGMLRRNAFGLVFMFGSGKVYAANAQINSDGSVSGGKLALVGDPIFHDPAFEYRNLTGKQWDVSFSLTETGACIVTIDIAGQKHTATVSAETVMQFNSTPSGTEIPFDPKQCTMYLASGLDNTTLSVDLLGITNPCAPERIHNGDVMPPYVSSLNTPVDANGIPTWLSSAMIMEMNLLNTYKDGSIAAVTPVLDYVQELGVNALMITCVGQPGIKNDGTAGNAYCNLGLHTIDPALTGTEDYEKGWQVFADFVEQAHQRNIYILFNVVTWGTAADSELYANHPEWYTGADLWGGKAFNWNNEELKSWYEDTLVDIVCKTNVDGIVFDCEPQYCGAEYCARLRARIQETNRNLVYLSENVNTRENAFDSELYGVMNYIGFKTTSEAIHAHQLDDFEFFIDEGYNIVDVIKTGRLSGTPAMQQNGTGGQFKHYIYSFSNHDAYDYSFQSSILDAAYQGFFSSYIPKWNLSDEFGAKGDGLRLYVNDVEWIVLTQNHNRTVFEEMKSLIRIRREYGYVFDAVAENHRNTNICKVNTIGDLDLQAYARYADNTGILVVGNHSDSMQAVTAQVTVPFADMNLDGYYRYVVTDLRSGEIICQGSRTQVEQFTVTVPYDNLGLYSVVGAGTAYAGLTAANMSHAMLRNGNAAEQNTALNSWAPYLTVTEGTNGLHFRFTQAVTTVAEGINVPVNLGNFRIRLDNISNYTNHGTESDPSMISLAFGKGGYSRNQFGMILDFHRGRIYTALPGADSISLLVRKEMLLESELLTKDNVEGKEVDLQLKKQSDDSYLLTVTVGGESVTATIDASYLRATDSFDPAACYFYLGAAGATPTVEFDLVGWSSASSIPIYFSMDDAFLRNGTAQQKTIAESFDGLTVLADNRGRGLHFRFDEAQASSYEAVNTIMPLDGLTLYFSDVSNFRNYDTGDNEKFQIAFLSGEADRFGLGLVFDMVAGNIHLNTECFTGRVLFSDPKLTYDHFENVEWSLGFSAKEDGSYTITLVLPDGTYTTDITSEELASVRGFDVTACSPAVCAWNDTLTLAITMTGYAKEDMGQVNHTVSFCVDGVVQTQVVADGGTAIPPKAPNKAYDVNNHYIFSGWVDSNGKEAVFTDIFTDTVYTAVFTADAHTYTVEQTLSPSCTETGLNTNTCTCGYYFAETVPATGHKEIMEAGIPATCTASGISDGCHCETCGKVLAVQEEVPALGHFYQYGVCKRCGEHKAGLTNYVDEWGVSLHESIGVAFKLALSDAVASRPSSYVSIEHNGKQTKVPASQASVLYIEVSAAEMNDTITVSIVDGSSGIVFRKDYSVCSYANQILAGEYPEETKNLVKAMLHYGGASQQYFGYNTDNLANVGLDAVITVPGQTASPVSVDNRLTGVQFYGATLLAKDKTVIRYYFKADSVAGLTFTCNGKACTPVQKDGLWYVDAEGIIPDMYDQQVVMTVSDGTNTCSVIYSVLNYIERMYHKASSSESLKAWVCAIYNYHLAAKAYTAL